MNKIETTYLNIIKESINERETKKLISQAVSELSLPRYLSKAAVEQQIWEAILNHDFDYDNNVQTLKHDIYYYLRDNGILQQSVIKEDAESDLQEMWNLQREGEDKYSDGDTEPGEAFPNEEQIWKNRIEEDKKICKWNQEHGRCCTKYCIFTYCQDEGWNIWRCDGNLCNNAAALKSYEKRIK